MSIEARTSEQWWDGLKKDPERMNSWLRHQYHSEASAGENIRNMARKHTEEDFRDRRTLDLIAEQEDTHAELMAQLLRVRGVEPALLDKEERFWGVVERAIDGFRTWSAVGAYVEEMSLERITVIAGDPDSPDDIRSAFGVILSDEQFHARAFKRMAGSVAMKAVLPAYQEARAAIGLSPYVPPAQNTGGIDV